MTGLTEAQSKLLAAADQATAAVSDMIARAREGDWSAAENVGSGDTLCLLVDSVRLLIEATGFKPGDIELHRSVEQWLQEYGQ